MYESWSAYICKHSKEPCALTRIQPQTPFQKHKHRPRTMCMSHEQCTYVYTLKSTLYTHAYSATDLVESTHIYIYTHKICAFLSKAHISATNHVHESRTTNHVYTQKSRTTNYIYTQESLIYSHVFSHRQLSRGKMQIWVPNYLYESRTTYTCAKIHSESTSGFENVCAMQLFLFFSVTHSHQPGCALGGAEPRTTEGVLVHIFIRMSQRLCIQMWPNVYVSPIYMHQDTLQKHKWISACLSHETVFPLFFTCLAALWAALSRDLQGCLRPLTPSLVYYIVYIK